MVYPSMKVAIYIDRKDMAALGEKCISAIRQHMPHAEIWHLTTPEGPELSSDQRLCMDVQGPFAYRQSVISACMTGDVLYLDADVIVREDISNVFDDDFDLCVTTDMRPGAEGIKYNGGVIFCRVPEYWEAMAEAAKSLDFMKTDGDWEPIERARAAVNDSGKYRLKVLPGEEYNYVPMHPDDIQGKCVHYRGNRKKWLFPIKEFQSGLNTSMGVMISQAQDNLCRGLPEFKQSPEHDGEAIIIGGGPSLVDYLPTIRFLQAYNGIIFALNGAHDWLIKNGIIPDYHVILDARQENVRFVERPHKDVTYLIAAQCHPEVFDKLAEHGANTVIWTACTDTPENDSLLVSVFQGRRILMVGGGATVGLKTMNLAYLAGFRNISLFGMDSSYKNGENHAYKQDLNDGEETMPVHAAWRDFICAPWMAKQAMEFQKQFRQMTAEGCSVKVYGDGLLPHIYQTLTNSAHIGQQHPSCSAESQPLEGNKNA